MSVTTLVLGAGEQGSRRSDAQTSQSVASSGFWGGKPLQPRQATAVCIPMDRESGRGTFVIISWPHSTWLG